MEQQTTISPENALYGIELILGERHYLAHALQLLQSYALQTNDFHFTDRLQSIKQNYGYLLSYYVSGNDDPKREEVLNSLYAETFQLIDDVRDALFTTETLKTNTALQKMRFQAAVFQPSEDYFSKLKHIFYFTWLGAEYSDQQLAEWDDNELCMWASARTLRLSNLFNEKAFCRFIQLADEVSEPVRQRILTGTLLLLLRYRSRLFCFANLSQAVRELFQNEKHTAALQHICQCILNTHLTPEVDKVMNSLQQDLMPKLNEGEHHFFISLDESEEGNPEWGDEIRNTMQRHIGEMSKLHEQGGDFNYISTRSALQENFFRQDIANWFVPFLKENPEIGVDFTSPKGKMLSGLMRANVDACDIDQYAICRVFESISGDSAFNHLPSVIHDLGEFENQEDLSSFQDKDYARNYVRNLYRFFRHNPWGIADLMQFFHQIARAPFFYDLYPDGSKPDFGDQCLALKLYALAEEVFSDQDAVSLQKRGFALQKQEKYEQALECFRQALLFQRDEWTLHHCAICLRRLGKQEEALNLYTELQETYPDKPQYLRQQAQCLLAMERYADALQTFFKLDILFPDDQSKRGIGWCAFLCNKMDIAEQYLEQLAFSDNATDNDLLNYAHLLLVTNHREEAIATYLKVASHKEKISDFLELLHNDYSLLRSKSVSPQTLALVEDAIVYRIWERAGQTTNEQ